MLCLPVVLLSGSVVSGVVPGALNAQLMLHEPAMALALSLGLLLSCEAVQYTGCGTVTVAGLSLISRLCGPAQELLVTAHSLMKDTWLHPPSTTKYAVILQRLRIYCM